MAGEWWRRPLRALQFNIEDPYGFYAYRIDEDYIVGLARRARANLLILFARDAWGRVFYSGSRLYPRHHNASFDLRRLVEKAHKAGIRVVVMVSHTANRYLYRLHPSWAQRNKEGEVIVLEHYPRAEKVRDPHWPLICPNSPAMDRYFVREVEEALSLTGADGVLLDSFRYMPDPPRACYCDYCRSRFREEHGFDLPEAEDPEDERFRTAWEWRYKVVVEAIAKMGEAAKRVKPGALYMYNSHPAGWAGRGNIVVAKARNYLDAVFAEASEADIRGPGMLTIVTKLSRALVGEGKPVLVSRNLFYTLRPVQSAPEIMVKQGVREIVASGGHPLATIFSSQAFEDPRAVDYLASVYEELESIEEYIVDTKPIKYIGVIFDPETHDKYYWARPEHYIGEIEGFALMAMHLRMPWEFVSMEDTITYDLIKEYPIIIAAGMAVLNDDEEEAFREYVEEGGVLVATHEFGIMRPDYTYRHALALQDVIGVNYEGVLWLGYSFLYLGEPGDEVYDSYWRGLPRAVIFGDHSTAFVRERYEPRLGELVRARPIRTRVLAWGSLGRSAYGYEYTLGRSTPAPGSPLNIAGIAVNDYGKGTVIYYAVRLGAHYTRLGHPDYRELFVRPLLRHAPRPPVWVEAPETLQAEPYTQGDRVVVHLVNHTYNQRILSAPTGPSKQALPAFDPAYRVHPAREIIPVRGVRVGAKLDLLNGRNKLRAFDAVAGRELKVDTTDDSVIVDVGTVSEYSLVVIEPRA